MDLKGKKVLLMGLGILGGGVATARFLVERGAELTVTDMKTETELASSLAKLSDIKDKITFVLGEHREKDFLDTEILVINPDVPLDNKFVQLAREAGKQIENELTLFYRFSPTRDIVAITGTRGKTTTANWTYHIFKTANTNTFLAGNSSENPFLGVLDKLNTASLLVLEVPSYQLELLSTIRPEFGPKVALITNIFQDHLNRHKTVEEYAGIKANIFRSQTESDTLVLNQENKWTEFLLEQKPKAKVLFFSKNDGWAELVDKDKFIQTWGEHNFLNLAASILAVSAFGLSQEIIQKAIATLPQIKFRQEQVYDNGKIKIYNDTAATSPDATIAAIKRFRDREKLVLIAGGTDRELDFKKWAEMIKEAISPENLILLGGSATLKMKKGLGWGEFNEYDTLEECLARALERAKENGGGRIVFSPGAKSFEKFKNEFDRGEKFNALVQKL